MTAAADAGQDQRVDVGGGMPTVFNLETAFQVMNGQTGVLREGRRRRRCVVRSSGHARMYVLDTTYNLSERVFLYGTVAYVRNGGNSNFSLLATPRGATSSTNPMTGESQTGAYVGMMHTF